MFRKSKYGKKVSSWKKQCKDFLEDQKFYAPKSVWRKYAEFVSADPPLRLYQWVYTMSHGKFPLDTITEEQLSSVWSTEPCAPSGAGSLREDNSGFSLDVSRRFPLMKKDATNASFYDLLGYRQATVYVGRRPEYQQGLILEGPVEGFWKILGTHRNVDKVVAWCLAEGVPVRDYRLYRNLVLTPEERMSFQARRGVLEVPLGRGCHCHDVEVPKAPRDPKAEAIDAAVAQLKAALLDSVR